MILLSAAMSIDKASNPEFMNGIMRKIDKDENGMVCIIVINPTSMYSSLFMDSNQFKTIFIATFDQNLNRLIDLLQDS